MSVLDAARHVTGCTPALMTTVDGPAAQLGVYPSTRGCQHLHGPRAICAATTVTLSWSCEHGHGRSTAWPGVQRHMLLRGCMCGEHHAPLAHRKARGLSAGRFSHSPAAVFLEQCKNASSSEDHQHSVRKRLTSSIASVTQCTARTARVGTGWPKDHRAQKESSAPFMVSTDSGGESGFIC